MQKRDSDGNYLLELKYDGWKNFYHLIILQG